MLAARLPYEKSVVWPSSRCFSCYRAIQVTDNIPILGFLRLRGKCRFCGAPFSARYLWVELGTGLAFLALFLVEVVFDWFKLPGVKYDFLGPNNAMPSWRAIEIFAYHALFLAALIAAAVVDAEHRIIPAQVTYTVMVVGLIGGAQMPWPWPHTPDALKIPPGEPWILKEHIGKVPVGVQLWPFYGPTFNFAPPGSWKLGLLNAILGALVGSVLVRVTKWLFETGFGREALGLGDADLLMMAGAFLGWQIPLVALGVGAFAALALKLLERILSEQPAPVAVPVAAGAAPPPTTSVPVGGQPDARELPFGPGLAIGVVITWFAWPKYGPQLQNPFFDAVSLGILTALMCVLLLSLALVMRRPAPEQSGVAK